MNHTLLTGFWTMRALAALLLIFALPASAAGVRVKDLVMVAGARENQLVGYGLVTGVANDGDKNPTYTLQTVANMLQRFGVQVPPSTLSSKNVAVVLVTADIPPFAKPGMRLDVLVSSMGDAKTIQGGVLLQTPLLGADGRVYAVAQGAISIGGFVGGTGGPGGASVQKNHPTVGQIIGGALVEKEIPATIVHDQCVELLLRQPDFTSSARLAAAINQKYPNSATPLDATSVRVKLPPGVEKTPVDFLARLEALEVAPDVPARIVINERTGTIVANARVQISACAISHGNLTITIASSPEASQPGPLSGGSTVVLPRTETTVSETKSSLVTLPEMPTIEKVAASLNALGVTPRDMMAIFQAMKQAGALQAELIIR
ncbi:MAG: flagellar basal body P-ring protein FlgI [Verrucomicrobiae bacterium]|nr:flagellar basal body P-ring protein FlgI [Verrucomicrobiae bacterium]